MSGRWTAADWGTSNLRVWRMDGARTLERAESDRGMGSLAPDEFEPTLRATAPWLAEGETVVVCGMAGSRQGWREAPYAAVPCAPDAGAPAVVPCDGLRVLILPGLKQMTPADVMRGEETQIAGYLALSPEFDGVLCLPGTHTKWVRISAGEVVSFQTFMSGELFALLTKNSVLRHSTASEDWDDAAFAEAVSDSLSRPEGLASRLFAIRAGSLLHGQDNATGRARLSGLLIGAELAAARPYWLGQRIGLIGASALSALYATALTAQGAPSESMEAEEATLAGLTAAWRKLKDRP